MQISKYFGILCTYWSKERDRGRMPRLQYSIMWDSWEKLLPVPLTFVCQSLRTFHVTHAAFCLFFLAGQGWLFQPGNEIYYNTLLVHKATVSNSVQHLDGKIQVFLCCKWCFTPQLDMDYWITCWCEYMWRKKHSQGMMLSSSELSGSMSFSFAFSVLSLNIRTSSWRRSLTTALVWLAADAGRSFSLKNRHINLDDAFCVCVCVSMYSMFVCMYTVLTCHQCCAGWTGWAKLAQGCCLHHHRPHFGSVTFYCLSGHINIVGSTLRPCSCFLLQ